MCSWVYPPGRAGGHCSTRSLHLSTFSWSVLFLSDSFGQPPDTLISQIRSNYRLMENWQGPDGYLATHEPFAYVFDSLPVLLSAAVYIAVWPPRYLVEMGGGWKSESTEDLTKPQ